MNTFTFDPDGNWSGGGNALLNNFRHAMSRHPLLDGGPDGIPIYPRNVPTSRRLPAQYVLGPQNAWPWSPQGAHPHEWPRLAALRAGSEYHLRKAPAVHRTSSAIPRLGNAQKYSPVLHNPLDTGFEDALGASRAHAMTDAAMRFVVIGSVYSYRNLDTVIDAYRLYRDEGGTSGLFLAGPMGNKRLGRALELAVRGLPDVILRWGKMPREEALAAMRTARAVIAPSRVEASPFSVLEAACVNEAVIPANTLGTREILAQYGPTPDSAFFPPTSAEALASAMSESGSQASSAWHHALSDPDRREQGRVDWGDGMATWLGNVTFGQASTDDREHG